MTTSCDDPYTTTSGLAVGCGRCEACLSLRARTWAHRIMLEAALYEDNAFVTLTYDEEHVPGDGSLNPKDVQLWLKRLRKAVEPQRLRFYCVGEYGDRSGRPHYHAALFNFRSCAFGQTRSWRKDAGCCVFCDLVGQSWGLGSVYLGSLELSSARYIAGYVTKKLTRRDAAGLNGREPEFARMSLRPGIGGDFMHEVASTFMQFDFDKGEGDVPSSLAHGRKELPLGHYLKRRLRKLVGRDEKTPENVLKEAIAELRPLQEAARSDPQNPSLKWQVLKATKGKRAQIKARAQIYKRKVDL